MRFKRRLSEDECWECVALAHKIGLEPPENIREYTPNCLFNLREKYYGSSSLNVAGLLAPPLQPPRKSNPS